VGRSNRCCEAKRRCGGCVEASIGSFDDDLPAKAEVIGGLEHQVLVLEDKLDAFNVVSHTQDGKMDREGINDA
jgi:hypothetical protein